MTRCLGHLPNLMAILAMSCCSTALAQQPRYPQTQTPTAPQRTYPQTTAQQQPAVPPQQSQPQQPAPQQYPAAQAQQFPPAQDPQQQQQQYAGQRYPQTQPQAQPAPQQYPTTTAGYPTAPAGQRSDYRVAQQSPAQPGQAPAGRLDPLKLLDGLGRGRQQGTPGTRRE